MSNTLSEMWFKYKIINDFKTIMNLKGYVGKDLYILDVQLNLLKELIKVESKNVLSELLTKKTYYRLLKSIDKGIEYLPDLVENNENYVLNPIDRDKDAWISDDVLIFSCKSGTGVFSKVSRKTEGANYIDNRYQ